MPAIARPPFEPKYTDEQRDAMVAAALDRNVPATRVVQLAAEGLLAPGLEPFKVPVNTVRHLKRQAKERRRGSLVKGLTDIDPVAADEAIRKRLLAALDFELGRIERKRRALHKGEISATGEEIRQLARAAREIQQLHPHGRRNTRAPGHRDETGDRPDGATTGGIAGAILADHRRSSAPAPPPTTLQSEGRENASATREAAHAVQTERQTEPGARESGAGLASEVRDAHWGYVPLERP